MAATSLLAYLRHPLPKIRQMAGDHLFTVLCINRNLSDDVDDAGLELDAEIERLVTETDWLAGGDNAGAAHQRLAELVKHV
ncbi:hypothetical protein EC988_010058, partial [Linderina pennispora]